MDSVQSLENVNIKEQASSDVEDQTQHGTSYNNPDSSQLSRTDNPSWNKSKPTLQSGDACPLSKIMMSDQPPETLAVQKKHKGQNIRCIS